MVRVCGGGARGGESEVGIAETIQYMPMRGLGSVREYKPLRLASEQWSLWNSGRVRGQRVSTPNP